MEHLSQGLISFHWFCAQTQTVTMVVLSPAMSKKLLRWTEKSVLILGLKKI